MRLHLGRRVAHAHELVVAAEDGFVEPERLFAASVEENIRLRFVCHGDLRRLRASEKWCETVAVTCRDEDPKDDDDSGDRKTGGLHRRVKCEQHPARREEDILEFPGQAGRSRRRMSNQDEPADAGDGEEEAEDDPGYGGGDFHGCSLSKGSGVPQPSIPYF